mgnify:CR=1 FL=1
MSPHRPLILISNDDGIASPGLEALAAAVEPLAEVLVVAPSSPQSGAGRSMIWGSRTIERYPWPLAGVTAYAVDAAPALCVRVALSLLAPRPPALMLSGINLGENVGADVTISGTVGAALEAAANGVPSVAVSLEAAVEYHDNPKPGLDYRAAAAFARRLTRGLLVHGMPAGVDRLKVDVPAVSGLDLPWRATRISRQMYWRPVIELGPEGAKRILGYERGWDLPTLEPDSDIHALVIDRAISISPMTVDLSARVDQADLARLLAERLWSY